MNVGSFDSSGESVPLVNNLVQDISGFAQVTSILMKNARTGAVNESRGVLDKAGDQFYSNKVSLALPTGGPALSSLIYRFQVRGHQPLDVTIDYSKPKLDAFINRCNTRVADAERRTREQAARAADQAARAELLAKQNAPLIAARTHPTSVPSFSCSAASNNAEGYVCLDENLAGLDRQLATIFGAASASTANDVEALRADQQNWLHTVRDACHDAVCLADAYKARIASLQNEMHFPEGLQNPSSAVGVNDSLSAPVSPIQATPAVALSSHAITSDQYPTISIRLGEQGVVAIKYLVDTDGNVADVQVTKSSGHDHLD